MNKREYKPSYWHNPGSEPLTCLTLGQVIDIAADQWGEKDAFVSVYQDQRFTYREVREKADHLAAGLLELGLNPGDRLGIWGQCSSEWYISRLAAARAGLIAVLIDPAYQSPQLTLSLNKAEIRVLIFSEFFKDNSCYEIVRAVIPELNGLPESGTELCCASVPSVKQLVIMSDKKYRGTYRFNDVLSSARPEFLKRVVELQTQIQADEGCAIQFSSGTTGTPKGVLLSHHNLVNTVIQMKRRFSLNIENAKCIVATQFCHTSAGIFGLIYGLCNCVTCVIAAPVFDARKTLEAIIKERCTHIIGTPSLYVDMITKANELGLKVTTLQAGLFGGAPCSEQLAKNMKETLNIKKLVPAYGMTETSLVFSSLAEDTLSQTLTTVGFVVDHCEVKVVDREGKMVPMGTPGELWVRGYCVMLGYWKDEMKTREFMGPDRWAKTGDQFILQEDGYGRIVGRVKDMIIRIADNIFPKEIEDFFMEHPDVVEAQAFGVPDPKVGEEVCVYLRLKNGVILTEEDIRIYCKDKLPEYRIPRYIRFVEEFERSSAVGKVQKHLLLEKLQRELNL